MRLSYDTFVLDATSESLVSQKQTVHRVKLVSGICFVLLASSRLHASVSVHMQRSMTAQGHSESDMPSACASALVFACGMLVYRTSASNANCTIFYCA